MKTRSKLRIVLAMLAVIAAAVLFATYGTVLLQEPFGPVQLDSPSTADSDGNLTVAADSESRRALIMNADGDLTGVVGCSTADTPIDAITDVCASDGFVYISGVLFKPDSDAIDKERVVVFDKGGNLQGTIYDAPGTGDVTTFIKSLSDAPGGVVIALEKQNYPEFEDDWTEATDTADAADGSQDDEAGSSVQFLLIDGSGQHELDADSSITTSIHDAAFSVGDENHYATLSFRGVLNDDVSGFASRTYAERVFTAIDIGDDGTLYACDDVTGSVCASPPGNGDMREFVNGEGYLGVHANKGVITLCDSASSEVKLCDASGSVTRSFTEVKPSIGFSARMTAVWASALYLIVLAIVLAVRKARRQIAAGKTEGIGPMLLAVAVVSAMAIAIASLSHSSYQSALELRANEINAYADYLQIRVSDSGKLMEKLNDRKKLRGDEEQLDEAILDLYKVMKPPLSLVESAKRNNIGIYCTIYGKDDEGVFYLFGSSSEHVMGTSARASGSAGLYAAFEPDYPQRGELLQGHTLRDAAQYRFIQIPTSDGNGVAGVIEIGSKMRSFEASITANQSQRVFALLIMVLVVYLAYCELRACGRCLFSYRERQGGDPAGAIAALTRPFTLAITMLTGIDSVMTVLIARDLLAQAGAGETGPLLALPAVMLGIGLIIGQSLYGFAGSRVGLRRLMAGGACAMLMCACLTGAAVLSGNFWFYCAAKLIMSVSFGMLYTLGYSLPRLAADDDTKAMAAGGVKRTDTSAAALGTVLGGYAAQALGNVWVYALVAVACIPLITMALNLLPRGLAPLEELAQPDHGDSRVRDFVRSPAALALALFIVLPAAVAAGYASFLFPLFSADLGLSKSDINNIIVMGQLVVYVCINAIDGAEARFGKWRVATTAVALLGAVFCLFAINTTLVWSVLVIALVALLGKSSDSWKALYLEAANEAGVPAGRATGAMFATRSLVLIAQPFILGALLGAADSVAVIVIGLICAACAGAFFLATRHNGLGQAKSRKPREAR